MKELQKDMEYNKFRGYRGRRRRRSSDEEEAGS